MMIALDRGKVWYTSSISGTVGMLEPAVATGTSSDVAVTTAPVTPDCRNLGAGITSAGTTRTGALAWSSSTYTRTVSGGGLAFYQLPEDAYPWGITTSAGQLWVVDQNRKMLARLSPSSQIYLPLVRRQ